MPVASASRSTVGLEAELERVSPGFHAEVMAGRPHLFSRFGGLRQRRARAAHGAPGGRGRARRGAAGLSRACAGLGAFERAASLCGAGVFLGYDFHLGNTGPQLIEINTNAGGGLLNALLARAQKACCDDVEALLPGDLGSDTPEHLFLDMFRAEWRAFAAAVATRRRRQKSAPALRADASRSSTKRR
jgi:hypothetical protein